jgi:hypothetical protein
MKRWLLVLIALVIAVSALAVRSSVRATASRKREIGYQIELRTYSEALHPGMTRRELEDYLRSNNTNFTWVFAAYGGRRVGQYADLVKIGEDDSDVLERIELFRPYTGCL